MHLECHAMLGWAIGNLGGADRRLRNYCVIGAILPDIDAIPYVFGAQYYADFHHTFGHNVFLWAIFAAWATFRLRSFHAFFLSGLSFGSHLLTDGWFSGWEMYLFWPFSHKGYEFANSVNLGHPINMQLMYLGFVSVILLAFIYQRTPLDVFSPRLDQLVISAFKPKKLTCHCCPRPTNQLCVKCHQPVCSRHAKLIKDWRTICPNCSKP